MTEPKFTKGPWKVFEAPNGKVIGIGRQSDGYAVADAGVGIWGGHSDEAAANARLIAAAPQMYEALKAARNFLCEQAPNNDPLLDAIDAALSAAVGEA